MFINFSNHPSSMWGEEQLRVASEYGEIKDFSFPQIEPEASSDDISSLADEFYEKLSSMIGRDSESVVHIMGEQNFTYALTTRLRNAGITCLASTTVRDTKEFPDGKKVSTFKFVRFREYE